MFRSTLQPREVNLFRTSKFIILWLQIKNYKSLEASTHFQNNLHYFEKMWSFEVFLEWIFDLHYHFFTETSRLLCLLLLYYGSAVLLKSRRFTTHFQNVLHKFCMTIVDKLNGTWTQNRQLFIIRFAGKLLAATTDHEVVRWLYERLRLQCDASIGGVFGIHKTYEERKTIWKSVRILTVFPLQISFLTRQLPKF